jgi:hypothetical protein
MKTELGLFQTIQAKVQSLSTILRFDTFVKTTGRKLALPINLILSISLFWKSCQIETKKKVYELLELQSHCSYKTLVVNLNRWYKLALLTLGFIFKLNATISHPIKHSDPTSIPVCLNKNAKHHKTMQSMADWGHDGKGYFYGLFMHWTADLERRGLAVKFTSAKADCREVFLELNKDLYGLFVADSGFVSKELEEKFRVEGKRYVLIKPKKNMKKLATASDIWVYNTRMNIEIDFRMLKLFYGLVTSLPRSVDGYLANYIYSLLAYTIA